LSFSALLGTIGHGGLGLISIIIVNYNSGDLLRACLASIQKFVTVPYEVVVVDNQSSDNSTANLPSIPALNIVKANDNLGFPRACNLGAASAIGNIFHFLNPDTEVTENINEVYQEAIDEKVPQIHVTRILNTRTGNERSSHPLPTLRNVLMLLVCRARVDKWYLGASVILSKSLFERLDRWSTEYFMYLEDVDFFYKALLAGVKTVESSSLVVHHQGGSSRQVWSDFERLEKIETSAFIFARKFGLTLDYFVFKHAAYWKIVWREPVMATLGLVVFWKEFIRSSFQSRPFSNPPLESTSKH
jgi:GT2 family glycosyltransferase